MHVLSLVRRAVLVAIACAAPARGHTEHEQRYVMKNGELYDGDTLDAVWPEKALLCETWWTRRPTP
jgi:hypothetical protein